jgi:aminoglycoside phosphotransferase (APT) family kinase protein
VPGPDLAVASVLAEDRRVHDPAQLHVTQPLSIASMRELILAADPGLSGASFTVLEDGWDSVAVDVGNEYIFKFPREPDAAWSLEKEARLLDVLRPHLSIPIPALELFPGPPVFSRHRKIPGSHLLEADYAKLPEGARHVLAEQLATFYLQLHRLDPQPLVAAGATPVPGWPEAGELILDLETLLDGPLFHAAADALHAWEALPPDPRGSVYGFFDGHGWNMAFDHERKVLNGIFDFADSGFGDLHREFIYTDLIDRDLTRRVVGYYESLAGFPLDRNRIDLLSGVLCLSDLAGESGHPIHGPLIRRYAETWLRHRLDRPGEF